MIGSDQEPHLVEVDQRKFLLGDSVVKTSLFTQVDDLEGFENLCEFCSSNIGVDVEDLTFSGFGERSEDGESSGTNRSFDGFLVDRGDSSDESVTGLIEVFSSEDSSRDGTSASAESFESRDEFEVLGKENSTSVREGASVGDSDTYNWARSVSVQTEGETKRE
jgi:hypothetical protein